MPKIFYNCVKDVEKDSKLKGKGYAICRKKLMDSGEIEAGVKKKNGKEHLILTSKGKKRTKELYGEAFKHLFEGKEKVFGVEEIKSLQSGTGVVIIDSKLPEAGKFGVIVADEKNDKVSVQYIESPPSKCDPAILSKKKVYDTNMLNTTLVSFDDFKYALDDPDKFRRLQALIYVSFAINGYSHLGGEHGVSPVEKAIPKGKVPDFVPNAEKIKKESKKLEFIKFKLDRQKLSEVRNFPTRCEDCGDVCDCNIKEAKEAIPGELKITTWHGEGNTIYYVVKSLSSDPKDWDVIAAFSTAEYGEEALVKANEFIVNDNSKSGLNEDISPTDFNNLPWDTKIASQIPTDDPENLGKKLDTVIWDADGKFYARIPWDRVRPKVGAEFTFLNGYKWHLKWIDKVPDYFDPPMHPALRLKKETKRTTEKNQNFKFKREDLPCAKGFKCPKCEELAHKKHGHFYCSKHDDHVNPAKPKFSGAGLSPGDPVEADIIYLVEKPRNKSFELAKKNKQAAVDCFDNFMKAIGRRGAISFKFSTYDVFLEFASDFGFGVEVEYKNKAEGGSFDFEKESLEEVTQYPIIYPFEKTGFKIVGRLITGEYVLVGWLDDGKEIWKASKTPNPDVKLQIKYKDVYLSKVGEEGFEKP